MEILYKDKFIIVCHKDSGMLCEGEDEKSLPFAVRQKLLAYGESNTDVFVIHRLDRETSGVCVLARNKQSAAKLCAAIANRDFSKQYLAVVCGEVKDSQATLCDYLFYDRTKFKTHVVKRERKGVKRASLSYRVLGIQNGMSLLQIQLHTGRTHQIRAQFSSRGHAVVGDRRYGAPKSDVRGIALLSHRVAFPHPETGVRIFFRKVQIGT